MRVLVTGAGGQIGSDLVLALRDQDFEVCATDITFEDSMPQSAALDITEPKQVASVISSFKPDWVIHLAAILSASGENDPSKAFEVNLDGTRHVLDACLENGVARVGFASSLAVYGPGLEAPSESVAPWPQTMYGVTKSACEMLGTYLDANRGLDFRCIRFPGLINAVEPGGGSTDYAVHMYFCAAVGKPYTAFCRPDTEIPLLYMPDAIDGLLSLMSADRTSLSQCVYNIAGFSPRADAIADAIRAHLADTQISFEPDPIRQAILDSWPKSLDDSKARADWGWSPKYSLADMTGELLQVLQNKG